MAFTTIPDSIIRVGKAITRTLFKTYIKDSLDDLNSRITLLEGSAGKIVVFDDLVINAAQASTITGIDVFRAQSDFTLTDAKIYIFETGSLGGSLEVDFKKSASSDFSAASSVFTTKPSINFATANDFDESVNAVFSAGQQDISAGDYLRFDITSLPTGGTLGKFGIYLIGEAS